jgi:hypothetical protein
MRILGYTVCVILFATGCSQRLTDQGGTEMAIFTSEQAENARFPHLSRSTVFWTPSESTVGDAFSKIENALAEKSAATASNFPHYRCQVQGVVLNGRKVLSFNFYSKDLSVKHWRTKPVIVFDGGDSTFQVEFDVESNKCISVTIPPAW